MKKLSLFIFVLILLAILSCEKEKNESNNNYEIKGFAQKGPFQSGTNITLLELKNTLQPTGLTFYSTVTDSIGGFELPDIELSSHYVELMADGYYYNENRGQTTNEKLLLKAVADASVGSQININILTHFSAERIKYLVQNEGKTFYEAKTQSQDEILKIFNLDIDDPDDYEKLDISKEGELNSKLLAISGIIQGNRSVPALTEFLTALGSDIKTDGVIDSKELQTKLATSAALCNVGGIRVSLADYYNNDLGFVDFQNHMKYFIENTEFEPLLDLDFPTTAPEGVNLLSLPDNALLDTESTYCLSQNIDMSNLSRLIITFTILKKTGTGTVIYSTKDLTGWNYDSSYCSREPFGPAIGRCCGINVATWSLNSASDTPLTIKFQGSGEIMLTIYVDSESLPDNGGLYVIEKYMKW